MTVTKHLGQSKRQHNRTDDRNRGNEMVCRTGARFMKTEVKTPIVEESPCMSAARAGDLLAGEEV